MDIASKLPPHLKRALIIPIGIVVIMWSVEAWDWILSLLLKRGDVSLFDGFGIHPRKLVGIPGILLSPFLHKDFAHLSANTLPLLTLAFILALTGLQRFLAANFIIVLTTGAAVWLFGRQGTVHIGASGVVFGYLGFLLVKGFIEKRARWIAVSIVIGFLYAGYMHNLLPGRPGISWLSHFFGFLSGILAAWIIAKQPSQSTLTPFPNQEIS